MVDPLRVSPLHTIGGTLALLVALLAPAPLAATALAPFIDLQEAGLTTVGDGEGLHSWDRTTPVELTVDVGGAVRFALLYWAGSKYPSDFVANDCTSLEPCDDQEMIFHGTSITGTVIGSETWADHPGGERLAIGYFADVTSLVSAAGTGLQSFTFADGDLAANLTELDGVSLIVAFTDATDSTFYRVLVWDGLDFASGLAAPGENRDTAAVTFNHGAYPEPREAELTLVAGDGDASCDRVTIANHPDLINTLDASSGPDWDHDAYTIEVPADVGSTQVRIFAEPDDLLWQVAMLRLFVPQPNGQAVTVADLGLEPTLGAGTVDDEAPSCQQATIPGPPFQVVFTIQDIGSGVQSIVVTHSINADTVVPPFTPGTQDPIVVTSTKIDQTQSMGVRMVITDGAGNERICTYTEGGIEFDPPTCEISTSAGPPFQVFYTIQDLGSGLAEILVTESANADTVVPPFTVGTQDPVFVSSTKINQTQPLAVEIRATDLAGNVTNCDYEEGLVTIVKDTTPDDPQDFDFLGSQSIGAFQLDDEGGGDATLPNERSFIVPIGSYCVAEAVAPGFALTGIVCDDETSNSTGDVPNRTAHVDVAALEEVTCTFTNELPQPVTGTLIIVKDTQPDGPQDFPFTGTAPIGAFTLDDDAGADPTFASSATFVLPAGAYDVTEGAVAGYTLDGVTCNDADSVGDPSTRTAAVQLAPGETVTCTFVNIALASLTIVKNAVPDGPQDFAFTGSGTIGAFTLDDDAGADATFGSSATFALVPGAYTVTEAVVAGFTLANITCSDGDSVGDPTTRTAAVALAPGETLTCTFRNLEQATIDQIPTLGQWGALLLGLAVAALAVWRLRVGG